MRTASSNNDFTVFFVASVTGIGHWPKQPISMKMRLVDMKPES